MRIGNNFKSESSAVFESSRFATTEWSSHSWAFDLPSRLSTVCSAFRHSWIPPKENSRFWRIFRGISLLGSAFIFCYDSNLHISVFKKLSSNYSLHLYMWDKQGIYCQIFKRKSISRNTIHGRRVARGCNGGNCPPNSERSTNNFQINQAFDAKAKEMRQCNSMKLLKKIFYFNF